MERNFLQMAEGAYTRIRRMDNSPEDFDRFRTELAQTNEILRESMGLMKHIRDLCDHRKRPRRWMTKRTSGMVVMRRKYSVGHFVTAVHLCLVIVTTNFGGFLRKGRETSLTYLFFKRISARRHYLFEERPVHNKS